MKRAVARGLIAVVLLGGMSGGIAGGSASASCQPVTSSALVCTSQSSGLQVDVYSDIVETHAYAFYAAENKTGTVVGDGFTNQGSGAFVYCDPNTSKYRLAYVVLGVVRSRSLRVAC